MTLQQLATRVGLSPAHLQRRFQPRYGLSPREFGTANRSALLRRVLRQGESVSRATYRSGHGSISRVYESAHARLGMTPARFAKGGQGMSIRYTITDSALGKVLVAV